MKNYYNYLRVLLLIAIAPFMFSCEEEDPTIDVGEGLEVGPGFYLTQEGQDPIAAMQISAATVDGDDFSAQEREGFYSSYIYLSAGNYNLVEVADREIIGTYGGSAEMVEDELSGCEYNSYMLVPVATDGSAFSVANDGLYVVSYDQSFSEVVYHQIQAAGVIGNATEGGWGSDTQLPMEGTVSAEGATWEGTDVILREGEWKIRFNCRWNVDRRIDSSLPFADAENGYSFFTNFGGSVENLLPGNEGGNMQISADGEYTPGAYTVTVTWDPATGFTAAIERTGDAPELTFDPADYQMGIIGDATAGGWDADRNMFYKEINGVPTWIGVVTLAETGNLKIRANDAWDFNLGGSLPADGTEATLAVGGADIPTPGAGQYYITVSTADEGSTWTATMIDSGWGLIGVGSPQGNWDADTDMNAEGFADGITTYTITGDFTTEAWKFRAGDAWDLNLGGSLDNLSLDGSDLTLGSAGTYTVTLSFDGENYTATAEAQ